MKTIPRGFLDGGAGLNRGHPFRRTKGGSVTLSDLLESVHSVYASAADVAALGTEDLGGTIIVGGRLFAWQSTSTAVDSTNQVVIRPTAIDVSDAGRYELVGPIALRLPITFATVDAATLFTVPAGWKLSIDRLYYDVSVSFVNASGRVGASSSNAAYNTKGDLIGGAGGDAAAALAAGIRGGTIGAKFGSNGAVQLAAGDTIRWDIITAGYTAGAADLIVLATRV